MRKLRLTDEGHLLRLRRPTAVGNGASAIGLYAAGTEADLDGLLHALPLAEWLQEHPDDAWRITAADRPITYSPPLDDAFLPLTDAIVGDVRQRLEVCAC
jgi:hypothetical protein